MSEHLPSESAERRSRLADWVWQPTEFERIFGKQTPASFKANLPRDTRLVVLLTFDIQGDADAAVLGFQNGRWPTGDINWCDLTMRQFDVRQGYRRLLRILRKHDIAATFMFTGLTAQWYPAALREIASEGHEIGAHGFHHVHLFELTDEEEELEIERATTAIAEAAGEPPRGWRSPRYSITTRTLDILRRQGYQWNSDFHNEEQPYFLEKDGSRIVEIPAGLDDWGMYLIMGVGPAAQMGGTPYGTYGGVLSTLETEYEILLEEGSAERPTVFQICMHPKISGRPFRAAVLDSLLTKMRSDPGVTFARAGDLARWCE